MKTQIGILTLILSGLGGCSREADQGKKAVATPKAADPVAVQMAAAEVRKVEKTVSVTGSLLPDETVSVSAEVPGRGLAIRADFGQRVKKGDILAEIDKQELTLQCERTKASLAQALARAGLRPGQENATPETSPSIRQAAAQFEDARSRYENAARLVKTGDIARERFTELEKAHQARKAAREASQDELRVLLANIQALGAEAAERAAQEKVESETRLFQTGESTNFLVLTRQNEYLDSRRRAVVASLDLGKAVSRLEQALGATLGGYGISLK